MADTGSLFSDFTAISDPSTSSVNVSVRLRVPTTFAQIGGLSEFIVNKSSGTSYSMARIEVALALDVTGSMNDIPPGDSVTKLEALKIAATRLVDALFADAATDSNVRISLVPWSSGVLAGAYTQVVSGSSLGNGCLVERAGSGSTSDSLPGPLTYAYPMPASSISLGYTCPTTAVAPLAGRQQADTLKSRIQGLTGSGGTAGHLGAAWAWWMLSPNWRTLHPENSRPEPFSRNVVKVAIIMTDGVFNTSHAGGTLSASGYSSQSYDMFRTICEGMRNQGIRVYTVAFDLNDATALQRLADCSGSNALTAASSTQLDEVFRSIVAELSSIRITR
jgi:hypothetical protein